MSRLGCTISNMDKSSKKIKNLWGTFTVSVDTGLPLLPEGQFWKLLKLSDKWYELKVITYEAKVTRALIGKKKSKKVMRVLYSILITTREFNPDRVQYLACQLLETNTPEWIAMRDAEAKLNEAYEQKLINI